MVLHNNIDINFRSVNPESLILKIVNSDDFIVLNDCIISVFNNNVVIETTLKDNYIPFLINHTNTNLHSRSSILHIVSPYYIIIMYTFVIDELSYESDNYTNNKKLKINIVSDKIEYFKDPNTYIRRVKLQKIINNIKCLKK